MPNMRSKNVGALLGILAGSVVSVCEAAGASAPLGSGLTCSAKINRRLSAVPSGVQVTSVIVGFVTGLVSACTSVGFTTSMRVTLYA